MNIVIAGGGKLGFYLVKTLLPYKHKITVIEPQKDLCEKIANQLNIMVLNGDGTNIDHLTESNVSKAEVFIAVTGRDEENLIACQLAKRKFGVSRTIARVNNPKNISVFEKLGVDMAVSSTSIIADLIEQEVDYCGVRTLVKLKEGKVTLSELLIPPDSQAVNMSIKDLDIPKDIILTSVIRGDSVIIPKGDTILMEGDYIIAASGAKDQKVLMEFFLGK